MKAALYLRSSKDRSDVSIDAQRRQLHEMAVQRGYVVVQEYADAVESGKDDDRPAFQQMLQDMRAPGRIWQYILVLDTARIARRRVIGIIFEEHECKRYEVKLVYKSLPDADPITEMLLKSILQAMDEWHSLTSRVKGLAGMAENVKQGYRAGGSAPRGYKLQYIDTGTVRDGEPVRKSKLILDDSAMQIRAYLQQRAKGTGRPEALTHANLKIAITSLVDLEYNALTYAGHTVWNRAAERNEFGYIGGRKYRPRSEWVVTKNTHDAIITEAEAEIILANLEVPVATRKRRSRRIYLFAGIMKSPDGRRWHGDDGYYRLEGNGPRILADSVEKPAIETLVKQLQSDKTAANVLKFYKKIFNKTPDEAGEFIKRIADIDKNINALAELLIKTTKPDALLRQIESLEEQRELVQEEVERINTDQAMVNAMRNLTDKDVKKLMSSMVEELRLSAPESLRDAMQRMLSGITLDPVTFAAEFNWNIPGVSGDKLASPRGFEPRSPP